MAKAFKVDLSKAEQLAKDLGALHQRGIPYALRDTLNRSAFAARREWPEQMRKRMTLRNRWTERSIRVERAQGLDPNNMHAVVGSLSDYVETQEFGGVVKPRRGDHKAIPTPSAAGQSQNTRPRTRLVRRQNWLSAIHLQSQTKGGSKQENAIAIKTAAKTGGVAFLDLGRRKGLFRVTGAGRRKRVRMLWDLSKPSVTVKPRPTLEPTVEIVMRAMPDYAVQSLQRQIDEHLLHVAKKAGRAGFF
jgi:hypothetical protein